VLMLDWYRESARTTCYQTVQCLPGHVTSSMGPPAPLAVGRVRERTQRGGSLYRWYVPIRTRKREPWRLKYEFRAPRPSRIIKQTLQMIYGVCAWMMCANQQNGLYYPEIQQFRIENKVVVSTSVVRTYLMIPT
jgi:hypothetical protein